MNPGAENVLMEREYSGFRVELAWLPITQTLVLRGAAGDVHRACTVPTDKALDAFRHPCVYLPDPNDFFAPQRSES